MFPPGISTAIQTVLLFAFDFKITKEGMETWRDRHLPIYHALLWMTRFLDKWIGGTPRNWLTQKLGKPTWKMNLPSFSRWIAVLCTASPSSSTIRLKLLFHMKRKSLRLLFGATLERQQRRVARCTFAALLTKLTSEWDWGNRSPSGASWQPYFFHYSITEAWLKGIIYGLLKTKEAQAGIL